MNPEEERKKEQRKIEKAANKERRRIEGKRRKDHWTGIKMIFAAAIFFFAALISIVLLVTLPGLLVRGEDIELYWIPILLGVLVFFSGSGYLLYKNGRKMIRENKPAK